MGGMSARASPRLLLVEDHALLAEALSLAMRLDGFDVHVVNPEDLGADAVLDAARELEPEVVLLDLHLGGAGLSIGLVPPLVGLGARVLMLTASSDEVLLARCIEAGADGVFFKGHPFEELTAFVTDAASGRAVIGQEAREHLLAVLDDAERSRALPDGLDRLTARESAVLAALVEGKTAEEIASEQFVALSTVRSHIRSILMKLGVNSQLAAVAMARRANWPPPCAIPAP
jgi:two-component system, NarL family, nitrate/nitrite response regulator NarL